MGVRRDGEKEGAEREGKQQEVDKGSAFLRSWIKRGRSNRQDEGEADQIEPWGDICFHCVFSLQPKARRRVKNCRQEGAKL